MLQNTTNSLEINLSRGVLEKISRLYPQVLY
jgi:hypothetical protein